MIMTSKHTTATATLAATTTAITPSHNMVKIKQ